MKDKDRLNFAAISGRYLRDPRIPKFYLQCIYRSSRGFHIGRLVTCYDGCSNAMANLRGDGYMEKSLKGTFLLLLLMLVPALLLAFSADRVLADDDEDPGYFIESYDVMGTVHNDRSVTVQEAINVHFLENRHGIFRYIPQSFSTKISGIDYHYDTEVTDVQVEGAQQDSTRDFSQYTEDGNTVIQIGDEDKEVTGLQKYFISYTYEIPWDRTDKADFFYYTVLPSWDVNINHFSYDLHFENSLPENAINHLNVYSGPVGENENALAIQPTISSTEISGQIDDVAPHNCLSFYMDLPEGFFQTGELPSADSVYAFLALTMLLSVLTIILAIHRQHHVRRFQEGTDEMPTYYPPAELTPAEAGTILSGSSADQHLYALIPWWAEKGYITIEKSGEDLAPVIHKVTELPPDAKKYEKIIFDNVFDENGTWDLNRKDISTGKTFAKAKKALANEFKGRKSLSKGGVLWLLMAILILSSYALMASENMDIAEGSNHAGFGIFILGIPIYFIRVFELNVKSKWGKAISIALMVIPCILYVGMSLPFASDAGYLVNDPLPFLLASVLSLIGILKSPQLYVPSDYRLHYLKQLSSLKNYMEDSHVASQISPDISYGSYYFQLFPFAMALGVEAYWAKKFQGADLTAPRWFRGGGNSSYDWGINDWPSYMSDSLGSSISQSIGSDISDYNDSISSSSDGGSSGGGGGGGGGGSW